MATQREKTHTISKYIQVVCGLQIHYVHKYVWYSNINPKDENSVRASLVPRRQRGPRDDLKSVYTFVNGFNERFQILKVSSCNSVVLQQKRLSLSVFCFGPGETDGESAGTPEDSTGVVSKNRIQPENKCTTVLVTIHKPIMDKEIMNLCMLKSPLGLTSLG